MGRQQEVETTRIEYAYCLITLHCQAGLGRVARDLARGSQRVLPLLQIPAKVDDEHQTENQSYWEEPINQTTTTTTPLAKPLNNQKSTITTHRG